MRNRHTSAKGKPNAILLIDGPNLIAGLNDCGYRLDIKGFLQFWQDRFVIRGAPQYFDTEIRVKENYLLRFQKEGYRVLTHYSLDVDQFVIERILEKHRKGDQLILVSGDSDYIRYLRKADIHDDAITIASTENNLSRQYLKLPFKRVNLNEHLGQIAYPSRFRHPESVVY